MKRFSLILVAAIFSLAICVSASGQNQYRSVASGNWSTPGTWELSIDGGANFSPTITTPGTQPTDTVLIKNGHTVTEDVTTTISQLTVGQGTASTLQFEAAGTARSLTITGDVTIAAAATLKTLTGGGAVAHNLLIGGNFSIGNGATFEAHPSSNRIVVTFNSQSASDQTITSPGTPSVNFDKITISRGASNRKVVCSVNVSVSGGTDSFTWTSGTWEQTGFNLSMSSGNQNITSNGTLRITGSASFTNISGSVPSASGGFAGTFFINTSGNINIGDGSDSLDVGTGSLEVQAGTVNVFGQLRASSTGSFTVSGGQIRIDPQDAANLIGTKDTVEFVGASNVSFTGGTLTIIDPNANTGSGNSLQVATGGTKNFAGSTIAFGNGSSTTSGSPEQFELNSPSGVTLGNIVVNNPSGTNRNVRLVNTTTNFGGNLSITAGTLDANTANMNIGGNWSNIGTFIPATRTVTFNGSSAQSIGGSSATAFDKLSINNSGTGVTLDTTTDVGANVSTALTLTSDLKVTYPDVLSETTVTVANSSGAGDVVGVVRRSDVGPTRVPFGNVNVQLANDSTMTVEVFLVKGQPPVGFPAAVWRTYTLKVITGTVANGIVRLRYVDPGELNGNTEAALTLWRSTGSPTATWQDQGFTTRSAGSDYVEKIAVTGFSSWTLADGSPGPTAVRLNRFNAESFVDGVQLTWESGYEVNNLGYQLFREQNGQRTRVTPSIVAGSALIVGPGKRFTAGYSYSWFDPQGTPDSLYSLEAIDLDGSSQWAGPIYPYAGPNTGKTRRATRNEHERAMLLSEIVADDRDRSSVTSWPCVECGGLTPLSGALRYNSPVFENGKNSGVEPPHSKVQQSIAAGKAVKIQVRKGGWYRVTQAELVAAGFDPSADARMLQLYVDGEEVPISLSTESPRLGPNDTMEFYGVPLDTPTTDTRVYWLVSGGSVGKRMIARRGKLKPADPNAETVSGSFDLTTERREKLIYFSSLLNGDADNIFGAPVRPEPVTQTLVARNVDRDSVSQPRLEVALQGFTAGAHTVQLQVNGTNVGTMTFAERDHPVVKLAVNQALLREGDNVVSLASTNGQSDVSLIDWVRLTYPRKYKAENNTLTFSALGGQPVKIEGFSSANVRVVDVTDPNSPLQLSASASTSEGAYAVKVQPTGNGVRTLIAFTEDRMGHPSSITANQPSNWNAATNGADMVIVTHKDFRQAIEPLANLRRSQGLSVAVVDVEDVYDEFSYGAHTPAAIKSFLTTAAADWSRKPAYLLLVGDSSWDARNYLNLGENNFVPTKLIDTQAAETGSDDWFADFTDTGLASMAVGRLPARNVAQVNLMVSKIMSYEQERELNAPLRGAVMVADNGFETQSNQTRTLLPSNVTVQTINRADVGNDDIMRGQIVDALNQGPMIVNYYGHGSVRVWTGAGLLNSDLAGNLTNANRLSVYVMMTCLNGYATDANIDSLGEAVLKAQNGGAVAVWASSGFTTPQPQFEMNSEFYRLLFGGQPMRLGDAARTAKAATSDIDVRRTWILLGDPSMRVR